MTLAHTPRLPLTLRRTLALAAAALAAAGAAQAETVTYDLSFTDSARGLAGTGGFVWDTVTEQMSGLHWQFGSLSGAVRDSALAATYHSYDPLAGTYGELYYRFLTDPAGYLASQYNPLSISVGLMPSNVTGDYGFVAFGAERGSADATYLFYTPGWSVATQGYVSASAVPEPAPLALLLSGALALAGLQRRRSARA